MKRIQPFTIGTKLSVPSETKCPDYVGTILPVPALDGCELRNDSSDDISPLHHNSAPVEEHTEDFNEDVKEEEDRDSVSPPASSRSIRKIAMCANSESQKECHVTKSLPVEERLSDWSDTQLETEPWMKGLKLKDLRNDYNMPEYPQDDPDDVSHSQRRDLKDFENSLIQLTTSLDLTQLSMHHLNQEKTESPHQKKTDAVDLGLEMLRRQSPGDHVDKSWLKLRSLLRDYHQDLMLALDVSSFYQQADSIISAINCKMSHALVTDLQKSSQDKETREMTFQINMLNESASRLSNLHPTLARRVTCKQAEVKENWALLQEHFRNQKTDVLPKHQSTLAADPLTTCPDSQSFARNEGHGVMGKDVKEEQNRLRGFECSQGLWPLRTWSPVEECSAGSRGSLSESSCSNLDNISEKQDMDRRSGQMVQTTHVPSQEGLVPNKVLKESTTSTVMDNTNLILREDQKMEELLSQVEVLWDALQKKYGENDDIKLAEKELSGDNAVQMMPELPLSNHPPQKAEEAGSGMLAKFLELLDPSGYHKTSRDVPGLQNSPEMSEAGMSRELQGDQTYPESLRKHDQTTEELQSLLSTLRLRINQHLSRCAELSMDLLDTEIFDSDPSGLEGLQEQQDDLEAHYHIIEGEVTDLERLASQLQVPPPEQRDTLREEAQAILQAWEEVGRNMAENRGRLEKFQHIQDYFENYLAMITWTENTRSCVLAGSAAWRESEVAEMDCSIETKLDEFNKLAAAGQMLMQEETQFKNIIKERTDEMQSMLRWVQVNWRTQREQLKRDQNERPERTNDLAQQKLSSESLCIINGEGMGGAIEAQPSQNIRKQKPGSQDVSSVVSQESCLAKTSLGSSICLILSFDEQSSEINQVKKQWSPNNSEVHCISNDITLSTPKKEQIGESTSNIQVHTQQLQDNNSMPMQQTLEILPNVSSITEETEHKSPCGNTAQEQKSTNNTNHGQPVKSPCQSSPCNVQPSFCNYPTEGLQTPTNIPKHPHLSPGMDQMEKPDLSVMHQLQNQHSPRYNQEWTKQSHSDLETNQTPSDTNQVLPNQSNEHLRHEVPAEVTHRVFTYLHVSDNYKSPSHATGEDKTTSALCSSSVSLSSSHPSSLLSQNVTPEGGTVCNHNRFSASSVFTRKEPIRSRNGEHRRHSSLGNVGLEGSAEPSNIFRQRCNTWPEGERRGQESQSNSRPQVLIKASMLPVDWTICLVLSRLRADQLKTSALICLWDPNLASVFPRDFTTVSQTQRTKKTSDLAWFMTTQLTQMANLYAHLKLQWR
ncbi:uncharacterized protein si:dkey-238i5.2 isoform X2 [Xyrauchen texanus]|uniref:uncharacterized protein si:dkey-238i5.2 isoform X2 n=1 Tax=Xyrauchen texanus TaxID=154827 RepID=UPI002242B8E1|nr:uncharacterized protein si:dkey-238i5.2 isoform X2 [Xyrauchen texanus]